MTRSFKPVTRVEKIEYATGRLACAPGLPDSSNAPPYKSVFFGAQREWPNDQVGWTKIPTYKIVFKRDEESGDRKRIHAKVTQRDINREERKQAGWNLL